jgi:hypothetical protein
VPLATIKYDQVPIKYLLCTDVRFLVRTLQQSLWPTEIQKARVTASDPAVSLIAYEPRTRKFSLENNIHPQTSGITV